VSDYNLKSIRQDFKSKGIFYTQPELAAYIRGMLPDEVDEVYDPTCGNGGLLSAFGDDVQKYGQDINADQVAEAQRRLANFHGAVGDTLREPAFVGRRFRWIVANPPFSIKWTPVSDAQFEGLPCLPPPSKADFAFLAHILHYLADDGMAAVLGFPGILYRGQREGKIRQWMVERGYIEKVIHIKGGHFVDTSIATCLLVLRKNRADSSVTFEMNGRRRTVELDEIREQGFVLSPSSYIVEEVVREAVDPAELNQQACQAHLRRLRAELDIERMVAAIEGWSVDPFIDDIVRLAESYRGVRQ
jgi:type I restriction enzyme M protein